MLILMMSTVEENKRQQPRRNDRDMSTKPCFKFMTPGLFFPLLIALKIHDVFASFYFFFHFCEWLNYVENSENRLRICL